jgi:hypothetical protein
MKVRFYILIFPFIFFKAFAVNVNDMRLDELSSHSTWLKLLHYEKGTHESSVIDKKFFLASEGGSNPKSELIKTIEAYFKPFDMNDSNQHAQCRFPARYFWLSKHIDLPQYKLINSKCKDLSKWKLLKKTQSISVMFVSGYLGNPASAFGHSFIKLNQSSSDISNLFDTTISYGALLPPKYNMPEYIARGLFGGYSAAYSDKYFYHEDVAYSNQEVRDMWEYHLKLTDDEKIFFLLHAWELIGKKFQYFFLNRNCGYKVSEFLELLYEEPLIMSASVWYAPIETFYRLKELDSQKSGQVIDKITYHPSAQRIMYRKYKALSDMEKRVVGVMVENKSKSIPDQYNHLSVNEQSNVFDFLLPYYDYRLGEDIKELEIEDKELTRALMLERLKLPIRKKQVKQDEESLIITDSNQPTYFGLGLNTQSSELEPLLKFSPFAIEQEGVNTLDGNELVVFDTSLLIDGNKALISEFDLIRIQRLKTKQMPFDDKNPLSWNLHIGTIKDSVSSKRDYFTDFGTGLAWDLSDEVKVYSLINFSLHSDFRKYRYMPNVGLYNNFNNLRFTAELGLERDISMNITEKVFTFDLQYRVKDDLSIFVDYNTRDLHNAQFGLKWFYY